MLEIYTGLPGSGKSGRTCDVLIEWVLENRRRYARTGWKRPIWTNLELNPKLWDLYNDSSKIKLRKHLDPNEVMWRNRHVDFLNLWDKPRILPKLRNADVIWEEMGAHVSARGWETMPGDLREWLQQHRHRRCRIVGNVQEFADIDVAVRRLAGNILHVSKIIGSKDPIDEHDPPPRHIWGLILETQAERGGDVVNKPTSFTFSGIKFITKKWVGRYSMFNHIERDFRDELEHIEKICPVCGKKEVRHR